MGRVDEKIRAKDEDGLGLSKNDYSDSEKRNGGWSIVAAYPCMLFYPLATTNGTSITQKTRHIATCDASQVSLVFGNFAQIYNNQSIQNNANEITVAASLQRMGIASVNAEDNEISPLTFQGGRRRGKIDPQMLLVSEPSNFDITEGEKFFSRAYEEVLLHAAPPTPSASASGTGGNLTASSNFYLGIVYVMTDGSLSLSSTSVLVTTSAGANTASITVTSPTAIEGAVGYQVFMSARNDGSALNSILNKASDPLPFGTNAVITTEISQNSRFIYPNGVVIRVGGTGHAGGILYDGLATGEGYRAGDQTQQGALTLTYGPAANLYGPLAIIGRTKEKVKTIALIGDSNQAGTADHGMMYANGGAGTRAVTNQLSLSFDINTLPLYGYVRVPLGGETALQWSQVGLANRFSVARKKVTEYATNVDSNYGTNDLSAGLATLKAAILANANYYIRRGIKFFQYTIPPRTSSTDGWRTIGNQTAQGGSTETTRVQLNNWLRDAGPTGFVAQAGGVLVDFVDICKYLEVNSSNVLTQNGGLFRIPQPSDVEWLSGFSAITGTLTTGGTSEFRDSSKSWVRNAYKGYNVVITSGTQAQKAGSIGWNDATGTFNIYSSIGGTVSIGDTYTITLIPTPDGIHLSSIAAIWAAKARQEKFSELI